MRAIGFLTAFLVCFWLAPLAKAMEPMGEAEMDNVRAQSGIALGIENVQIYSQDGWGYRDTSGDATRTIEFFDAASYMFVDTRNPLTLRVMQNPDGKAMLEITGQPSIWMQEHINAFSFIDRDLGSLHTNLRPPDEEEGHMGFMEEFLFYVAPHGVFVVDGGDGIAYQLELRSRVEEFLWDYNQEDDDAFWLRGVRMADTFDAEDNPVGRFMIGNLDAYENDSDIGPATFQVLPDGEEGHAMLRFNLPMEGSLRIDEIGMYSLVDEGPQDAPDWESNEQPEDDAAEYEEDNFGPMMIDNMEVHHLQVDFRTKND